MDLGSVLDTTVGNPEGMHSPFQVKCLLRLVCKLYTERWYHCLKINNIYIHVLTKWDIGLICDDILYKGVLIIILLTNYNKKGRYL